MQQRARCVGVIHVRGVVFTQAGAVFAQGYKVDPG